MKYNKRSSAGKFKKRMSSTAKRIIFYSSAFAAYFILVLDLYVNNLP